MYKFNFALLFLLVLKFELIYSATNVKTIADHKEFKKLTRVDTNVLVYFFDADLSSYELKSNLRILNEAANLAFGVGTLAVIDCRDTEGKKLCKKLKGIPTTSHFLLKHYLNGEFHKDYDRQFGVKSIYRFLSDPQGDTPWEEEPNAKYVRHIESAEDFNKMVTATKGQILVMFYAPWCGHCKAMKPHYSEAAETLKQSVVLAAVDATRSENSPVVSHFNVKGYPTILYFNEGVFQMNYAGERTKEGIISWLKNPTAEQEKQEIDEKEREVPWSETDSDVVHLTDDTFGTVLENSPSVLVMFYAPWCGHCKRAKPEYEKAAALLAGKVGSGVFAAVDATIHKKAAEKYGIEGFPTFKYFKNGEYAWDVNERTADKLYEFMLNPTKPPPPKQEWSDIESNVVHLSPENFKTSLKKKRHALVLFYVPWDEQYESLTLEYTNAAEKLVDDSRVVLAAVDCGKHHELCQEQQVPRLPHVYYYSFLKEKEKFTDNLTASSFVQYISNKETPGGTKTKEATKEEKKIDGFEFHENVAVGTIENFDSLISTGRKLAMFYAPWCGHCKHAKPAFSEASQSLKKGDLIGIDCTQHKELCDQHDVHGYPTFKIFENGKFLENYSGGRTKADFVNALNPSTGETPKPPAPEKASGFDFHENVAIGSSENFENLVASGRKLVMFYAPWCGHCKNSKPAFSEAAQSLKKGDLIGVDCTQNKELCAQQKVGGYPTFKIFENGKFVEIYNGGRVKADFLKAINPTAEVPSETRPSSPPSGFDFDENVKIGNSQNFDELVTSSEKSLVMFYAPWCGHCKSAKPAFNDAAKQLTTGQLISVDCTTDKELCQRFNVGGYPTFKVFESGKSPEDYRGNRNAEDFLKVFGIVQNFFDEAVKEGTQENFEKLVGNGKSIVMFYAPWCGHCKNSKPAFNDAAREVKYVQFIGVDCTIHQDLCLKQKIGGYPSFKVFENGKFSSDYQGGRSKSEFMALFPKNVEL